MGVISEAAIIITYNERAEHRTERQTAVGRSLAAETDCSATIKPPGWESAITNLNIIIPMSVARRRAERKEKLDSESVTRGRSRSRRMHPRANRLS